MRGDVTPPLRKLSSRPIGPTRRLPLREKGENAAFSVELFKGLMLCFEIVVENERKVIANGPRSLSKACAIANASVGEGGLGPAHFQLLPYKSF